MRSLVNFVSRAGSTGDDTIENMGLHSLCSPSIHSTAPQIWIECDLKIDFVHSMNVVVDWRPNFNWPFIHSLWACIRTKFYSYYRFISTRILLPCSQNPQNSNYMHVEEDIAPALRFYCQYCTTKAKNFDGNRCLIYVSVRWIELFLTHKSVWKNRF